MVDTYKTEDLVAVVMTRKANGYLDTVKKPLSELPPDTVRFRSDGKYEYKDEKKNPVGSRRYALNFNEGEIIGIYHPTEHAHELFSAINLLITTGHAEPLPYSHTPVRTRLIPPNEKVSYDDRGRPMTLGGLPEWYFDD